MKRRTIYAALAGLCAVTLCTAYVPKRALSDNSPIPQASDISAAVATGIANATDPTARTQASNETIRASAAETVLSTNGVAATRITGYIAQSQLATNNYGGVTFTFTSTLCTNTITFNAQGCFVTGTHNP